MTFEEHSDRNPNADLLEEQGVKLASCEKSCASKTGRGVEVDILNARFD